MFIGRVAELTKLNELYAKGKFQCVVVYGRRRVGKTSLLSEFVKDKEAIYFFGRESNQQENLAALSREIMAVTPDPAYSGALFPDFTQAVEAVFAAGATRRLIFVIDEYPYLASAYKGISSLLQMAIDKNQATSKLFIILCGSSLSFMENQVLGYQSPLFGRRTAQFKLLPFSFAETADYYRQMTAPTPSFDWESLALIFGITGGIPQYVAKIDPALTLRENIMGNFFEPTAYLFEEPANLIKQECREPAQYNSIIRAIAEGASRLSEIAGRVGIDNSLCSNYLATLITLGIVRKEMPFRGTSRKKTIYSLADSMFRFWYRFVPGNLSLIQRRQSETVYERVAPQLPAFMGKVFEDICAQWLWQENIAGNLPLAFTDLGRWWGNDPVRKEEAKIDLLADIEKTALFGECKWTNEPVNVQVLQTLAQHSQFFGQYQTKHLYLFAKNGFTGDCITAAAACGAKLISYSEMY